MSLRTRRGGSKVVVALAAGRTAVGLLMIGWPSLLPTLLKIDRASSARMAWVMRMVGGREIALGFGSFVTGRAGDFSTKRTWLAVNMITDGCDSVAIAAMANYAPAPRRAAAIAAAAAAMAAIETVLLARTTHHAR